MCANGEPPEWAGEWNPVNTTPEKLPSSPRAAISLIERTAAAVLTPECVETAGRLRLPDSFTIEASYKEHPRAYRNSFYPGAFLRDANTVVFESNDFYEILRFMHFCM